MKRLGCVQGTGFPCGGVHLRNLGAILQLSGDSERVDADWIC